MSTTQAEHLEWFRNASPYINLHRGRTFVIYFGGEAVLEAAFPDLVNDIALLSNLGIRLVLVHGVRPQIDSRLRLAGIDARFACGMRVTDDTCLEFVKEAVGSVRIEIEGSLSRSLPNTPMSGARLRIASGNFVTAQPWGVRDGVDFGHTGAPRRIDARSIHDLLELRQLVLLSPLGYSATGEVFNLLAESVATEAAVALHADKLVFMLEGRGLVSARRRVAHLTPAAADKLLAARRTLDSEARSVLGCALQACRRGVPRTHLVSRRDEGSLLQELFTRDGAGTLLAPEPAELLRAATVNDVAGVLELIEPLEAAGNLVRRSREQLELEIGNFRVIEKEGTLLACAALYPYADESLAEVACVAVHRDYLNRGLGARLLQHLDSEAAQAGLARLFVLSTRTAHWFREHGFANGRLDDLPVQRRRLYNYRRGSKVLFRSVGG